MGTSNVGPVTGGEGRPAGDATNVVTDYVHVRGESRSHDRTFFKEITKAYKAAFEKAAKRVKNSDGRAGRIKFKAETDYYPFRMKDNLPVVKRAEAALTGIGCDDRGARAANGGLDANWMVRQGFDCDLWRRAERAAHDRRVDQSRRVLRGVCARGTARDDAVSRMRSWIGDCVVLNAPCVLS